MKFEFKDPLQVSNNESPDLLFVQIINANLTSEYK